MMKLLLSAVVVAAASLAGCSSVLEVSPYDRIPADQTIVDASTAQAALNGAYEQLESSSLYGLDVQLLGDLPSDNGSWGGTYQFLGDITRNTIAADNPEVTSFWSALYREIDRVNTVIVRVPQLSGVATETANEIMGEAYFLRALSYHNLVKFWGDVPMPLVPVKTASDAASYTRASVAQVYTQILSDLDKAASMITNTTDTRRATVDAVTALRARVLFYKGDYAGALTAANTVLDGRDTLTVAFADLFTATGDDTDEDIFRVAFTAAQSNSLGYYWLQAGRHEARVTTNLYNAFEPGDLRKVVTTTPRSSGSTTYQGNKYPTTAGTEHPHVIRLAELVLIKAEVLARQSDLAGAVAEYNKVRLRAGLAAHTLGTEVTTQSDVLAAILKERRLELALEGDRWPDLVRLGLAGSVKTLAKPGYTLFPIPLRDMTTTPGLTQNPDY
jgi:outer membrane murein-binding lipoprotein Lpp